MKTNRKPIQTNQNIRKYNIWLHADCAWGGAVIFSEKHKHLMDGCEMCDSIAYNPHKMLGAPLQASLFLTRHKELLHQSNCAASSYLFMQDKFYDVSAGTIIVIYKYINNTIIQIIAIFNIGLLICYYFD